MAEIRQVQITEDGTTTTYSIGTSVAPSTTTNVASYNHGHDVNTTSVASSNHTHTSTFYYTKTNAATGVNAGTASVAVASSGHAHTVATTSVVQVVSFSDGVLTIQDTTVATGVNANTSTTKVATYSHSHTVSTAAFVSTITTVTTSGYITVAQSSGVPNATVDVATSVKAGTASVAVASSNHTH